MEQRSAPVVDLAVSCITNSYWFHWLQCLSCKDITSGKLNRHTCARMFLSSARVSNLLAEVTPHGRYAAASFSAIGVHTNGPPYNLDAARL